MALYTPANTKRLISDTEGILLLMIAGHYRTLGVGRAGKPADLRRWVEEREIGNNTFFLSLQFKQKGGPGRVTLNLGRGSL